MRNGILTGLLALAVFVEASAETKLPLTVADLAGWVRPTPWDAMELPLAISAAREPPAARTGNESGNRERLAIAVLKHSNWDTGLQEYSLISFSSREVVDFINAKAARHLPHSEVLLKFETGSSEPAIQQLRWLPGQQKLLFLGFRKQQGDMGQVYQFDVPSRTLTQLTHHPDSIQSFDFSPDTQKIVYSSDAYPASQWPKALRYVMGAGRDTRNDITAMISGNPDGRAEITYFALDRATGESLKIESDEPQTSVFATPVYVSSSGRWAVRRVHLGAVPKSWAVFDSVRQFHDPTDWEPLGWTSSEEPFGGVAGWVQQFQLMDLAKGETRPLIDAPGLTFQSAPGVQDNAVVWTADDRSVVVAGTYLPLGGNVPTESAAAMPAPVVAEVEIATGHVTPILTLGPNDQIPELQMSAQGELLMSEQRGNELHVRVYRKEAGQWLERPGHVDVDAGWVYGKPPAIQYVNAEPSRLRLFTVDDLHTPPQIKAIDTRSGRSRLITDLNPNLSKFELGRTQAVGWTDRMGAQWTGGLTLPAEYKPGLRLPVVMQLHGFDDTVPYSLDMNLPAYPGRLLLSRGIALLQVGCEWQEPESVRLRTQANPQLNGFDVFNACIDAAIDSLDKQGLIDRERVGIIGFSALGNHVYHAITFAGQRLAAAMIVDSVQSSLWDYLLFYGSPRPTQMQWDTPQNKNRIPTYIGAPFFGQGIQLWTQRSPMFHLDRIQTPLLFEYHLIGGPCPCWDTYAILKRQQRPVELAYFPQGGHNLGRPAEQFYSREAMLDWFAFWLTGKEDPDPAKVAQFQRWHVLRAQHEANLAAATADRDSAGRTTQRAP